MRQTAESMSYYGLLQRNSQVRRIWFSQIVSELGDWFNLVALLSLVSQFSGKAQTMGLLLIIQMVPFVVLSPVAGYVADRFDRRKVMIFADLSRAVVVLGFLLINDPKWLWVLYVLAAVQFMLTSFFEPARSALISSVAAESDLVVANALSSTTWSVMFAMGTALGGFLIAWLPLKYAFLIDSASFVVSAICLAKVKVPSLLHLHKEKNELEPMLHIQPNEELPKETWFFPVLQLFRKTPGFLAIFLVKSGFAITSGVVWLLASFYGQKVFPLGRDGSLSLGIVYGTMGVGAILGSFWVKRVFTKKYSFGLLVFWLYLLRVSIFLFMGFSHHLVWVLMGCLIHMFTTSILWTISTTMIQKHTPNQMQGRIFALDNTLHTLSFTVMIEVTGFAVDKGILPNHVALASSLVAMGIAGIWFVFVCRPSVKSTHQTHVTNT